MHSFYFKISILLLIIIGCGKNGVSSFVNRVSNSSENEAEMSQDISELNRDELDESTNPPVMIIGANLSCHVIDEKSIDNSVGFFCYFEKDGEQINLGTSSLAIEITNENGSLIASELTIHNDGTFTILASLEKSGQVKISVTKIGDSRIENNSINELATEINLSGNKDQNLEKEPSSSIDNSDPSEEESSSSQVESVNEEEDLTDGFCNSIGTPGTWILVPGNPDYNTNDFCVMKYEAKTGPDGPISTYQDLPWVNISQTGAIGECTSLGEGFHLITNDEWMTIATNIAAQGINWDGGTVGTNEMTRGHSDNNPTNACEANASDENAYVETNCAGSSSGQFNQRRTHALSNGEMIWDLAGTVREWTSYFNDEEKPTPNIDFWYEFTEPIVGTATMPLTDLIPQAAIDNSWNATQSIGRYYPGTDSTGGALRRGGDWEQIGRAGVFTASLRNSPTFSDSDLGFRCAASIP